MISERRGRAITRARVAGPALVFFLSWFPVAVLSPPVLASEVHPGAVSPAEREYRSALAFAGGKIGLLRETAAKFRALAREPVPPGMGAAERKTIAGYDRWLQGAAGRCEKLAMKWEQEVGRIRKRYKGSDAQGKLLAAAKDMQEMQMSFNLQYLQLQNQMQNENRQFSMVSNIMKTKHDTVKNSISNIR